MRELVIARIKKAIVWDNECNSWQEDFIPKVCPDFANAPDEVVLAVYESFLMTGPVG